MKEKDHWFYENSSEDWGWEIKKELWNGKRFSQLSWFWNPDESWTHLFSVQIKNADLSFLIQT